MKYLRIFLFSAACLAVAVPQCNAMWLWPLANSRHSSFANAQEQMDWAMGFYDRKAYKRAQNEFRKIIKKYPDDPVAADAQFYIARCLQERGKYFYAQKAYQEVLDSYPANTKHKEIVEQQFLLGDIYMSRKEYGRAKAVFEKALQNGPYVQNADVAQFKVGVCLFRLNKFIEAKEEFAKIGENYSFSPYLDDAMFYTGLATFKMSSRVKDYDQGLVLKAKDDLNYFLRSFPTSEYVPEAESLLNKLDHVQAQRMFEIARFYEKRRKLYAAQKYYEELIFKYEQTSWATLARPLLAKLRQQSAPQ